MELPASLTLGASWYPLLQDRQWAFWLPITAFWLLSQDQDGEQPPPHRLASALATPQIWCLLASPWGDPPLPRWPTVLCMFTEAAGLGSGCVLGLHAPYPNHVFSSPPQSSAGA